MSDELISRLRVHGDGMPYTYHCNSAADLIERYNSIMRPECPTCGGIGWIVVGQTMGDPYGERNQCPHCIDGKIPLERCAAIANAVMGHFDTCWDTEDVLSYLRNVVLYTTTQKYLCDRQQQ